MSTYVYQCQNKECDNLFEAVHKMTDPDVESCPLCDSPVQKVIGVAPFANRSKRAGGWCGKVNK